MAIRTPGLRAGSFLLVGLSLSVGWGIRGNFGHEYGAMIAGTLSAIAACAISGRADWRVRLPYMAMFGALGWGFGGSISYMQVIAYTHSGHFASQIYGFANLFLIGFLWAALGGAGTAFGAVADDSRLREVYRPLGWIFMLWLFSMLFVDPMLERLVNGFTSSEFRHTSPLYWFDSDWIPALTALLALSLYDLWDRRFARVHWLIVMAGGGALAGFALQQAGVLAPIGRALVHYQGDATLVPKEQLLINWPQFFLDIPQHLGWIAGLIIGLYVYFAMFGEFRGASMLVHMAVGWFAAFLILPVLLGIHMTPPRSDDWAGILGVFLGLTVYLIRHRQIPILFAAVVAGIVGGLGFSGVQMMKLVMLAPGNPNIVSNPEVVQYWAHWRSANWHSWLEQNYGFVNGLGIALAMGLLATRVGMAKAPEILLQPAGPARADVWEWLKFLLVLAAATLLNYLVSPGAAVLFVLAFLLPYVASRQVLSIAFVLFLVTFLNLVKNVDEWVGKTVPPMMTAPLFSSIQLSARTWFVIVYLLISAAGIFLMMVHTRRRKLAMIPPPWLGKSQLLYLVFLWVMVIGNFERALVGFSEGRLFTEWVISVNAVILTVLILLLPKETEKIDIGAPVGARTIWTTIAVGILAFVAAVAVETGVTRAIYGDQFGGFGGKHIRFGPDATWRVAPIQKGQEHR